MISCKIRAMLNLTILHTNDIHGRVSQLVRIAALVRNIRREVESAGGYCLYIDAGDSEDTTLLESSLTKGSAMEAILRGAGCEYAALGNAIPIRYGHQAVADLAKHFGYPLLCANMKDENGELVDGLEPYIVKSFDSLKVGMIGLTAPMDAYTSFFKLKMDQPIEVLPELIAKARAKGAQTILLLSHLGSEADKQVAEKIQGIDVIIGAHDHKEFNPPLIVKDTIIAQAGDFGRLLGRLDLEIDPGTGKVIRHAGILIPITEDIPLDPEAHKAVEAEQVRAREIMNREVGILKDALELFDERECAAGNLLADALLERVEGAQISLVLGHWQNGLEAGTLTQGTLFSASRSTANPGRAQLTGEQILQFLRESLKPENAARTLRALRGRAVGMPHIAGGRIRYTEDLTKIQVEIQGRPLDENQKYMVASTDMEFSDYINYLVIPFEQMEFEVPTIMPEVLEDYITRHSPVQKPKDGRIMLKAS
jgi:5'-nucleotidase